MKRNKNGTFATGNAGGGRKPIPPDVKQMFVQLVPEAVQRLANIIKTSTDDKLVLDAAKVVLDRVYGKAPQALDIQSENNHKIEVTLTEQLKTWAI